VEDSYSEQLKRIWSRGRTKIQLMKDAPDLAVEADKWRQEAAQLNSEVVVLQECCQRAQQLVRDLLADCHKRNDQLAAKLGLANLADDDPAPEIPPSVH
jgi:hypothetical protein